MNDRFIGIVAAALDVFGFGGRAFRVGKGFALVVDDKHTVNVVPGPGPERARVFCFVGTTQHVPPGISVAGEATAPWGGSAPENWQTHHEDHDGVTWSIGYESVTGLTLLSTDAALDSLDAATVSGWLETFFQHMRDLNRQLAEGKWDRASAVPRRDRVPSAAVLSA